MSRKSQLDTMRSSIVGQSISREEGIFSPSSMGSRKLAIDVLLPRWDFTGSACAPPRLLSINAFLASRVIRFSLSLFPVNPSRGGGRKKRHPGRREKSLSRGGERPSRPTSWNGEGAVKRGCRWINRGGGGEQDRPKDGVLWGFHGWCSRKFAYRASVTSPLAPAPGHSRLGISPGADLRDNGDHSYGKSDGGKGGLRVIRCRATLRNCLAEPLVI